MTLPFAELKAITDDYFILEDGKATDIYFQTSYLLKYFLDQQKGLWKRPAGGDQLRIPLEYDGQEAGFYSRGDPLNSTDRESINAAIFDWKHAYGNATILRVDELKNDGPEAKVELVAQRVAGAQKSITKLLASSIYDPAGGASNRLTGLLACCNTTTSLAYGGIAQAELVAADGTFPWTGRLTTTVEGIGPEVLRTMITTAHIRDGGGGEPDLIVTTRALFDILKGLLQVQQRFTRDEPTAKAGFKGLEFDGVTCTPDDFCPASTAFALNSRHIGFAVHKKGLFVRTDWKFVPDSAEDKTMKILFDGNLIVNNRSAQIAHDHLS